MESPQLYDSPMEQKKVHPGSLVTGNLQISAVNQNNMAAMGNMAPARRYTELHDLNSPEISLDLQNLIDDSQFSEGIFQDILKPAASMSNAQPSRYQRLSYVPQALHFQQPQPEVKEDPEGPAQQDFRYQPFPNNPILKNQLRKHSKQIDKNTDEYKRRRERNNIAVRKSREKAKMRSRETEEKVKLLMKENERLQKRIELLTEELNVLRSLFSSVGVLPEHLHRELNKHLETYQQH